MQIESVHLKHYRGIDDLQVSLHPKLTVLVGNNGIGKTSVLDALSLMLFSLRSFWPTDGQAALYSPSITASDITINRTAFSLSVQASYCTEHSEKQPLSFELTSDLRLNAKSIRKLSALGFTQWQDNAIDQPLFVYYRQNRGFNTADSHSFGRHISRMVSKQHIREQSLSNDLHAIPDLSFWWDNWDAQEARIARDHDPKYRNYQLEAIRNLVDEMDEFESIGFNAIAEVPGLHLKKTSGPSLHVGQLSSGERVYLILLADLARRLQLTEPDADLGQIPGIILIDEIELSLHPDWQRRILSTLMRIFSGCQFIVSTHSPQVVGQISDGKVVALSKEEKGEIKAREVLATYGRDSNDILIDVLRSTERDKEIKMRLEEVERCINQSRFEKAQRMIAELRLQIGNGTVELDIAEQRLRRRKGR